MIINELGMREISAEEARKNWCRSYLCRGLQEIT